MTTTVYHLGTTDRYVYSLDPRAAVIAAYAQIARKDWNTWDYEAKYGDLPRAGRHGWHLGDFSAPFAAA